MSYATTLNYVKSTLLSASYSSSSSSSSSYPSFSSSQKQLASDPPNHDLIHAKQAIDASEEAALATLPVVSASGLGMMFFCSGDGGGRVSHFDDIIRLIGLPIFIGGIVIDSVKAPVTATFSLGALLWSGVLAFKSLFTSPPKHKKQYEEILESAVLRFANTLKLLVGMKLETAESIYAKLNEPWKEKKNRNMSIFIALTLLNTAFASRSLYSSLGNPMILLANGKLLYQEDCPEKGLVTFKLVRMMADTFRRAGYHNKTLQEVAPLITSVIPLFKKELEKNTNSSVITTEEKFSEKHLQVLQSQLFRELLANLKEAVKISMQVATKQLTKKEDMLQLYTQIQIASIPESVLRDASQSIHEVYENNQNESENKNKMRRRWVDKTGSVVRDAVVGSDSCLYDQRDAQLKVSLGSLSCFIRLHCAGGPYQASPDHEDTQIDHITTELLENCVIANDGHFYSKTTADNFIKGHFLGLGGVIITRYISVDFKQWRFI